MSSTAPGDAVTAADRPATALSGDQPRLRRKPRVRSLRSTGASRGAAEPRKGRFLGAGLCPQFQVGRFSVVQDRPAAGHMPLSRPAVSLMTTLS